MQVGSYAAEFCEHVLLFAKQRKNQYDVSGLRALVQQIRAEGINFAIADDMRTTASIESYDIAPHGSLRPPYPVTIIENLTEFDEGDKMPTIIIALDYPDKEEIWWTYTVKELVPSKRDPTKTHYVWRVPIHFWSIPYKHCGKFSERGEPQLSMAPYGVLSKGAYEEVFKDSNMSIDEYNDAHAVAATIFVQIYAGFCAAIHGHEVTFTDVEPNEAANKMRRARGKMPLFSYKTLTIGKPKRKSRHLGGTHASPRSHLRRGYFRTSQKGVRHWVQPCMVKGETDGFVHKDYIVEGEAA
jgi:hypothetical protein